MRGEELAELLVGASVMGCAVCCVIGVQKRAVLVGQRCTTPGGEARGALLLQTQEVGRDGGCQGAPCYPSTDTGCLGGWCCSQGLWCSPAAGPGAPRGMFCVLGHALLVLPALCAQLIPRSSRRAPARLLGGAVPTARQSVLDKRPPGASRALGARWQEHNAAPAAVAVTDGALTAPGETGGAARGPFSHGSGVPSSAQPRERVGNPCAQPRAAPGPLWPLSLPAGRAPRGSPRAPGRLRALPGSGALRRWERRLAGRCCSGDAAPVLSPATGMRLGASEKPEPFRKASFFFFFFFLALLPSAASRLFRAKLGVLASPRRSSLRFVCCHQICEALVQ